MFNNIINRNLGISNNYLLLITKSSLQLSTTKDNQLPFSEIIYCRQKLLVVNDTFLVWN